MVKSEENVISNENELKNIVQRKDRNNYYEDDDLKTPGHDKIVGKLINDGMLSKIANIVFDLESKNKAIKEIFNKNDKWTKKEEFPIKVGYNFKYIDLCATLKKYICIESCFYICTIDNHCENNNVNKKCTHENNFKDCPFYKITKYDDYVTIKINIEVKTIILSIGELIRQINVYREFNDGLYLVITPNVTNELRNRLNNSKIYLIDTKQLDIVL